LNNWRDRFKGLGTSTAKAIAGNAKTALRAVQENIKDSSRKRQIVDKMYARTIRELAHQRGLRPEKFFDEKPTIDDYKDAIVSDMSLEELIDFAKKKRIDIRDVTEQIDQEISNKEQKRLEEDPSTCNEFKSIAKCIRDFRPPAFPVSNRRHQYWTIDMVPSA